MEQPKAEGDDEEEPPAQEEEEEVDEEELKRLRTPIFQKNIYPSSVVMLRGDEDFLKKRADNLPKEKTVGTHWNANDIERRFGEWNRLNSIFNYKLVDSNTKDIQFPLQRFYQEHETEVFEIDSSGETFEMFQSMRFYIERNGRPYNFLDDRNKLNENREKHLTEEESQDKSKQ